MSNHRMRDDGLPVPYDHRKGRNFVEALPERRAPQLPTQTDYNVHLDIMPNATQHVELRTSAVDRARGHALSTTILAAILGVLAVLGMWGLRGYPYLSFWILVVFWVSFAVVWAGSWFWTQLVSPEGVSLFEAHRKWNVVDREQKERWAHYRR